MAYVLIRGGVVTGVFATAQPDIDGFTEISDNDPRLLAFLSPPVSLPDQAATELATRLGNGIVITSTGTPALNATYALDTDSQAQIFQLGIYANQFAAFPGGATQAYPDATGAPHTFSVAQFVAFLRVVAPLVSAMTNVTAVMSHGGTPVWPAQTGSIP